MCSDHARVPSRSLLRVNLDGMETKRRLDDVIFQSSHPPPVAGSAWVRAIDNVGTLSGGSRGFSLTCVGNTLLYPLFYNTKNALHP